MALELLIRMATSSVFCRGRIKPGRKHAPGRTQQGLSEGTLQRYFVDPAVPQAEDKRSMAFANVSAKSGSVSSIPADPNGTWTERVPAGAVTVVIVLR